MEGKNPHLSNLVSKVVTDFNEKVAKEQSESNILLKGHLFTENLLEEALAVFDHKHIDIGKMGFSTKVSCLREIANKTTVSPLKEDLISMAQFLQALNELRNNLAHDLNFNVTESSVNKIGLLFGSKFIMKKYESGHDKVKDNLLFCLRGIVTKLGRIIFIKAEELKGDQKKG